jgi:hypothetical protein
MPNELRCCRECGNVDFSWITEYIERGHVIDDGSNVGYREPQGMMEPAIDGANADLECDYCGCRWQPEDLISQDEAYHNEDLSAEWMIDYTPEEPLQDTLSEE